MAIIMASHILYLVIYSRFNRFTLGQGFLAICFNRFTLGQGFLSIYLSFIELNDLLFLTI